ncbi:MAG: YbbR-like domain-containing protein [Prevotella sp.]|nr:YbbR-like domain-containing protein [Prevotella sp.]
MVSREFLTFLFFLLVSGFFWLMMTLNGSYEKEIAIPVRLSNVPRQTVITTNITDTVRLTVSDQGFALVRYMYGGELRPIVIDFMQYAGADGHGVVGSADIQKMVRSRLQKSTKLVSLKVDKLEFFFSNGMKKKVPVVLNGHARAAGGLYMSGVVFYPDTVTAYITRQLYDSVKSALTERLNIVNVKDTFTQQVSLQNIKGVKYSPAHVQLKLCTDVLTEMSIMVPINVVNLPEGKRLRTFPSRVNVRYIAGASVVKRLTSDMFRVDVDYNEIEEENPDKCTLHLRKSPPGLNKVYLETKQVDYLIESGNR